MLKENNALLIPRDGRFRLAVVLITRERADSSNVSWWYNITYDDKSNGGSSKVGNQLVIVKPAAVSPQPYLRLKTDRCLELLNATYPSFITHNS